MIETVKTVRGYAITRRVGTRGFYSVKIREGKGFVGYVDFRTIKAAVAYIEANL